MCWLRKLSPTNLNWSFDNFGATWTIRYYSSLQESCHPDVPELAEYFPCTDPNGNVQGQQAGLYRQGGVAFNDLQVYWNAPWHATISLGANDIFNRVSPNVYGSYQSGDTPYDYNSSYDLGRYVYVRYSQKF